MSDNGELIFDDVALREFHAKIGGEDYVLVEPTEDAARKYRNAISSGARASRDGQVIEIGGVADSESVLVAACIYKGTKLEWKDGRVANPPTPLATVRSWPRRIVRVLYQKLDELQGESPKAEDEAKNLPAASGITS